MYPKPEDQDLDVVEMGESGDEETPFRFSLPWDQTTPIPEEEDDEDDEDASLSGGPTLRSARMDFPAVMTLAAQRVGLPLPPPLPLRPVSRGFTARYIRRSRTSFRPSSQKYGSVWRRHGGSHLKHRPQ